MLMSHEAMQDTVKIDFSSSANAARRGNQGSGRFGGGQGGALQGGGGGYQGQGGGGYNGGGYQGGGYQGNQGGGYQGHQGPRNGGRNGGRGQGGGSQGGGYQGQGGGGQGGGRNNGGGNDGCGRRPHVCCQICGIWGHEALSCRNHFNQVYQADDTGSGNAASTSQSDPPHWLVDSGATDHLTHDMERLHVHERYNGRDQVQVTKCASLSISHIGHSRLAGPMHSLAFKNILHVPAISKSLLFVHKFVSDNDVFIEFHRHFFCVKDTAMKKIILQGRSHGGLYPIPFHRASSSTAS
jgi:histone deacetylase 1/2